MLTNVYDNCEITDANVCVCVCVRDKRRRLHFLFHPPSPPSPSRSCPSKEPQLSWVFVFKGAQHSYLTSFLIIIFTAWRRADKSRGLRWNMSDWKKKKKNLINRINCVFFAALCHSPRKKAAKKKLNNLLS